jgi:hypothetical protein
VFVKDPGPTREHSAKPKESIQIQPRHSMDYDEDALHWLELGCLTAKPSENGHDGKSNHQTPILIIYLKQLWATKRFDSFESETEE